MKCKYVCIAVLLLVAGIFPAYSKEKDNCSADFWSYKKTRFGFEVGYMDQVALNENQVSNSKLAISHFQLIQNLRKFKENSFIYNLELAEEGTLGLSLRPKKNLIFGLNKIARLNFKPAKKVMVFSDIGAGVNYFGMPIPELTGKFQFSLQAGAGIKYKASRNRITYVFQYRATHFSNAGIKLPNEGINLHSIFAGINL